MAEQKRFAGIPAGFQVMVRRINQRVEKLEAERERLLTRVGQLERELSEVAELATKPRRGRPPKDA